MVLPSAFLGGITDLFFRQLALTISVAMLISAVSAVTMTPARAAWIFTSRKPDELGAASRVAPQARLGSRGHTTRAGPPCRGGA